MSGWEHQVIGLIPTEQMIVLKCRKINGKMMAHAKVQYSGSCGVPASFGDQAIKTNLSGTLWTLFGLVSD